MKNIVDAFLKNISSFLSESKIAQVSDLITICRLITRLRCYLLQIEQHKKKDAVRYTIERLIGYSSEVAYIFI